MLTLYSGELVQPKIYLMSLDEMGIKGTINDDMFPAAVQAMTVDETIYGYPTLLCGNLVTSIGPVSTEDCPMNIGTASQKDYKDALERCQTNFINPEKPNSFNVLLFGKMSDEDGWYLPYIYLDGYIDKHGESSLKQAVQDLEQGNVDHDVCEELRWFFGLCKSITDDANKCKQGSVSSGSIQDSIVDHKSVLMFSFSEKLANVLKSANDDQRGPQALASVPLSDQNNLLLQFTDGLVVSKKRWAEHEEDKRDAIKQFMRFFSSPTFRYKLAYGVDLKQPQVRYLLMPNKDFYQSPSPAAFDPIYGNARKFLDKAVPAPALKNKKDIQKLLNEECLTDSDKKHKRNAPRRKNEL